MPGKSASTKAEAACARNVEGGAKKVCAVRAALLQGPGLHDAVPKQGASHCQKPEGTTQRMSHPSHRGTPSWYGGVLAPVWAPGSQAGMPRTKPLPWTNAVYNCSLQLGQGDPTTTRPGATSEGQKHTRPARKPSPDHQRRSQAHQRQRKGCPGRRKGQSPPSKARGGPKTKAKSRPKSRKSHGPDKQMAYPVALSSCDKRRHERRGKRHRK